MEAQFSFVRVLRFSLRYLTELCLAKGIKKVAVLEHPLVGGGQGVLAAFVGTLPLTV
eukprot:SAG11_NODE_31349_length_292_cov_1.331606_1_plen_56_part_10